MVPPWPGLSLRAATCDGRALHGRGCAAGKRGSADAAAAQAARERPTSSDRCRGARQPPYTSRTLQKCNRSRKLECNISQNTRWGVGECRQKGGQKTPSDQVRGDPTNKPGQPPLLAPARAAAAGVWSVPIDAGWRAGRPRVLGNPLVPPPAVCTVQTVSNALCRGSRPAWRRAGDCLRWRGAALRCAPHRRGAAASTAAVAPPPQPAACSSSAVARPRPHLPFSPTSTCRVGGRRAGGRVAMGGRV